MASKVKPRMGDTVLYRIEEEISRPMLVTDIKDLDTLSGIVFCNGPTERIDLGPLKANQLAPGIWWVVGAQRGSGKLQWYAMPTYIVGIKPDESQNKNQDTNE